MPVPKLNDVFSFLETTFFFLASFNFVIITFFSLSLCLAYKNGISVVNTPGTIDSDYRGEIKVLLINLGTEAVTIKKFQRIAQMVICPIIKANLKEVQELPKTIRGAGGFGSTGQ